MHRHCIIARNSSAKLLMVNIKLVIIIIYYLTQRNASTVEMYNTKLTNRPLFISHSGLFWHIK